MFRELTKKIAEKYFGTFAYFYSILRNRIFVSVTFSIVICILDAFGLSMFLPLLQTVNINGEVDGNAMGNLRFLLQGISFLGVEINLEFLLMFMLSFFVFKAIASYLGMIYFVRLKQFFIKNIRIRLLDALDEIDFKKFVTANPGRIQNTMSGEVDRVAQAYSHYFDAFQQGLMVLVYMGFAFFVDVAFAILVSIGGAITNLLYRLIYKHTKAASGKLTTSANTYQDEIIQHVGNFKYLRAVGMVKLHSSRLKETITNIESNRSKIGVWGSIGSAVREPLLIAVVACVILIQINLLGGQLATILISLIFFYRALNSLAFMQQQWNGFMSVSGSLEHMQNFQKDIETKNEVNGELRFNGFSSNIHLQNVCFSYGETTILKNVNIQIRKDQTTAFIGESGSGKTTLVNLIAGLLPPDSGHIFINDIPLELLDKQTYQKRVGYITQEPVIFNDTIFNNVTFWSKPTEESISRFKKAISQSSLSNFLDNLPEGRNTQLGNNGINLSGGQKQRISIARELYKDIDILIMDEATSALDSETELTIQKSIEDLNGKYTLIIVAHRLSTIRKADHLVLMNEGQVEDEGNFLTMMEKYPRFRQMASLQEI